YANCNFRIFKEVERIDFINNSGLKFLWSNDMMWTTNEELEAIRLNKVDCCLLTSKFHYDKLTPRILMSNPKQKTFIIDNYFDSDTWPYYKRPQRNMVCGKVSRDDLMKFSENFPVFYESACSDLPVEFRIMGWSDNLNKKYSWFKFDNRWTMLKPNALDTKEFLNSIDIFLYNCNHRFIENQSRAIIEAQLTGCPIVAPNKWNFPNMIWHTRTGYLWDSLEELQDVMQDLNNYDFRTKLGALASNYTRDIWCDKTKALDQFNSLLNYVSN
ncbi:glycosyltransferase family 1 protein, partial [bacterium]|nr:glycosyltransferase family 1 protein [bacterium]